MGAGWGVLNHLAKGPLRVRPQEGTRLEMAVGRWMHDQGPSRGGGAVGPNPTDRAKSGTKRSLLTEGSGIPF